MSIMYLVGLLNGIQADVMINEQEASELQHWCLLQNEHIKKHPFNEIIPLVKNSLMDGVLTFDEIEDIVYSCNAYLIGSPYYDVVTSGIQVLQGIIHGILSDNNINTKEIQYLKDWLNDNNDLESIYPYDELYSLVNTVLPDGVIAKIVTNNGGNYHNAVVEKTDFWVVGDGGNPCWVYSCYGRKIEKAIELRKKGKQLIIAHEIDFWDSVVN
jgi:hypothetical protein